MPVTHLAWVFVYAEWRHLPSDKTFPRAWIYISAGLFGFLFIWQSCAIVIRNGVFRHQLSRAAISHDAGAVRMQLRLPNADGGGNMGKTRGPGRREDDR